jgi:hypothetical protein
MGYRFRSFLKYPAWVIARLSEPLHSVWNLHKTNSREVLIVNNTTAFQKLLIQIYLGGAAKMIQPKYVTLTGLFADRVFRIPSYQRFYSWQAKQREDLFTDIYTLSEVAGDEHHFMATIVCQYRGEGIRRLDGVSRVRSSGWSAADHNINHNAARDR